ncbi:MAG: TlpA family protein disulfide reductase, partial [Pseudomonadota bacterium]
RQDLPREKGVLDPHRAVMTRALLTRWTLVSALVATAAAFSPASDARARIGTPVADLEMATLDGGRVRLLAKDAVTVLLFFRPHQEHSRETLREMADCRRRLARASVRWVAIVSSAAPPDAAAAVVREAGVDAPVLVDRDDALYAALGVALHPVVVIVGRDHRLAAFEPYRSVNLCAIVTARIRRALGEISDEDVQLVLAPPKAVSGGDAAAARSHLRLAEALFKGGNPDKALESVRKSLALDAALAPAHTLLGRILAARSNCADAIRAFRAALALDPADADAQAGIERCKAAQ